MLPFSAVKKFACAFFGHFSIHLASMSAWRTAPGTATTSAVGSDSAIVEEKGKVISLRELMDEEYARQLQEDSKAEVLVERDNIATKS